MSSDDESAGCALLGLGVLVWIFWGKIGTILSFVCTILLGILSFVCTILLGILSSVGNILIDILSSVGNILIDVLSSYGIILIGVLFLVIFVWLVRVFTIGKGVTMRKVGELERQAMVLEGRSTRAAQEMKLICAYETSCLVDIPNELVEARVEEELRAIKQQNERK